MTASPLSFRISFLTPSGAETVLRWFTPLVQERGGTIELTTQPPEVYIWLPPGVAYEDLLDGWKYARVERIETGCQKQP